MFDLNLSVIELKTASALEPVWTSAKSSTTLRSSRGAHLTGLGTFLIVEADPSNTLIFLNYFCIEFSSSGFNSELFETNLRDGDLFLVISTLIS